MRIHLPNAALQWPAVGLYALLRRQVRWGVRDAHGMLARAARGEPLIFACRHGQLLPLLWAVEGLDLTVVVSHSHDGELLARVLARRGFGLIRGSSSRDGGPAARGALRVLRAGGRLGVAVDGPRGPRGEVQDGVLRLAQRARVPIVPLWATGDARWVAPGSWDHFELPRPRQRLWIEVGAPVTVGPGAAGVRRGGERVAQALGGWRRELCEPGSPSPQPRPSYGPT